MNGCIQINPYDCLGVKRCCTDENEIRDAYNRKSVVLDPKNTNNLTRMEFLNLNKSYLYIKSRVNNGSSLNVNSSRVDNVNVVNRHPLYSQISQTSQNTQTPPFSTTIPMSYGFSESEYMESIDRYKTKSLNYQDAVRETANNPNLDNVLNVECFDYTNASPMSIHETDQGFSFDQVNYNYNDQSELPKEYQTTRNIIGSNVVNDRDIQSMKKLLYAHTPQMTRIFRKK